MDRNISEWSAAEVQTELQRLGLGQPTTDIFTDIDGAMIQFVSKSELRSLGVPIKDRLKIQAMISKEKENQGAQNTKYLHKLSKNVFSQSEFQCLVVWYRATANFGRQAANFGRGGRKWVECTLVSQILFSTK